MLPKLATATVAAIAIAATVATPVPAHAWGKNEQNFVKGAAAAALIGAIIYGSRANQQRGYNVPSRAYRAPQQTYVSPRPTYSPPVTYRPAPQPSYSSGIYATPAAQAFNSYSYSERRRIQARLADWGYYNSGIDGSYGPKTHRAVLSFAGDSQGTHELNTVAGAYDFYGRLIR